MRQFLTQRLKRRHVFRGASAINDDTTAEPRRSWRCHCRLCRTSTAVAPRLRCGGGRRSAVLTVFAVLRRSMSEPLRNHGDDGGATAVYAVQSPQWHRASGVMWVSLGLSINPTNLVQPGERGAVDRAEKQDGM